METILVPLHAHEIALDPVGPDIAEFSFDEAKSQVAAILHALGDRAEELLESVGFSGDDLGTRPPKTITFFPNGNIEADGKVAEKVADYQFQLLELVYRSKRFAVSFTDATLRVYNDTLMDEDRIKKLMKRLNNKLAASGIGIHVFQKKMKDDFFICLAFVPKTSPKSP